MTRFFSVLLLLIVIVGFYLAATGVEPDPQPMDEIADEPETEEWVMDSSTASFLEEFETNFSEGLSERQIPGAAVAIVKDGRVIFEKGFGRKERGSDQMVDEHTVFRLGSVSKGFASVLAGVFVEEGLLNWNQPVVSYLNDFKLNNSVQTSRVEVQHLLSHTSGLPRHAYTNLVEDGLTLDRIIPRLQQVPLISREGVQLSYQNAAYSVIEKVLESQTGTAFNTLLHERLFKPLDMIHASSSYEAIQTSTNKALPHVYYSRTRGRVPISITKKYYNAVSSGGINASASDMGKWLLLLTGNYPEVISDSTLSDVFTPVATLNNRRYSRHWDGVNKSHYGLGWRVLDNHGQKIVYHGGYVNGFRSEIAFAPEEGIGICIMINSNSSYPLTVIPDLFNHFRQDTNVALSQ